MKIELFLILLVILMIFSMPGYAQESKVIKLTPTDDAYVGVNQTDPDDVEGLQIINTGDFDFLKSWYAWNTTENKEQIVTSTYLKFNLSDIELDYMTSAQLILTSKVHTPLVNPPNFVLTKVDNDWNESEINFINKPSADTENLITSYVSSNSDNTSEWYTWDIFDLVKQNAGSELSVAYSFHSIFDNTEEIVSFYSKETREDNKAPVLLIAYTFPTIDPHILQDERIAQLEKTVSELESKNEGGCIIATATYGTELAPQVQLLRELRDNILLQTESGKSFMNTFNSIYYTFSPQIADLERENPIFKETVKLAITPLITSLSILNYADIDSEAEMISYGIGIILLNGIMYGGIPVILVYKAKKWHS